MWMVLLVVTQLVSSPSHSSETLLVECGYEGMVKTSTGRYRHVTLLNATFLIHRYMDYYTGPLQVYDTAMYYLRDARVQTVQYYNATGSDNTWARVLSQMEMTLAHPSSNISGYLSASHSDYLSTEYTPDDPRLAHLNEWCDAPE